MLRPVTNLDRYLYSTDDIIIAITGSSTKITVPSNNVQSIDVIKMYDFKVQPYISITFQVSKAYYELITARLSYLNITLSLYKHKITDNNIKYKTRCFAGTFRAINQKNVDPSMTGKLKQSRTTQDVNSTQDLMTVSLYLYDNNKTNRMRWMNSLFLKGDIVDALYYTFQRREFNNVLLTPPTRNNDSFNIPYSTLPGALNYLNNIHGIYDTPYLFFMDFNTTYMISKSNLGKTVRPLEVGTATMYLEEYGSKEASTPGCFSDESSIILNLSSIPEVDFVEDDIEYFAWGKLTGIIPGEKSPRSVTNNNDYLERAVVINNEKLLQQESFKLKESRETVSVPFIDSDIDIFTPNKAFRIVAHTDYEPKYKLNGIYRLTHCVFNFVKQGESGLQSTVLSHFKKQP